MRGGVALIRQTVRIVGYILLGAVTFSVVGAAGANLRIEYSRDLQASVIAVAIVVYSVTGWLIWKVVARVLPRPQRTIPGLGAVRVFVVTARSYNEAVAMAEVEAQLAGFEAPRVDNWDSAEGLSEGTPWNDGSRRRVRVFVAEDRDEM